MKKFENNFLPIKLKILFFTAIVLCFSILSSTFASDSIKFEKQMIKVGGKSVTVELALTEEQQRYGLMNRTSLAENAGMLFVNNKESYLSFWMKNTYIDLSIAYIDKNKVIKQIIEMPASSVMQKSFPSYPSDEPAQYALEMNKGWFKKNRIKVGDKVDFELKSEKKLKK